MEKELRFNGYFSSPEEMKAIKEGAKKKGRPYSRFMCESAVEAANKSLFDTIADMVKEQIENSKKGNL